jgi:hypothetical protein
MIDKNSMLTFWELGRYSTPAASVDDIRGSVLNGVKIRKVRQQMIQSEGARAI